MGIYMGKSIIEERGRILIPKGIRDEAGLKAGQQVVVEKKDDIIVIRPMADLKHLAAELKGCIKKSRIKAMDIKKIWHM